MSKSQKPIPLDSFLEGKPNYKIKMGAPCSVCNSKFSDTLNESIKRFAERKALPPTHPDSTTMTRVEFVKSYVWHQFPDLARKDVRTIYRHAEMCLGVTLPK